MPNHNPKTEETDVATSDAREKVLYSLLEDIYSEKEQIAQQAKINFSLLEDVQTAKEKVDIEKARINAAVQNLTDGLASFDENGRVIAVNPKMAEQTGLPTEGFYLEEFAKLFKGIDVNEKIKLAFEKRQSIHIEEVSLIGRFIYEIFFTPVIDPQGNIIGSLILLHDITHIKEAEKRMTEFVSVASHQLRTPLTAIKLFVEMMAGEEVGKLNPQQRDYMGNVQESTERMIKLVNDLLNVSRLETGRLKIEPKLIQLESFIQDIIDEAKSVAKEKKEKKCEIIFKKPKQKLRKVPIDSTLMRQVIHNLIMNAIQYSPKEKSKVIVTLGQEGSKEYVISVKDEGIGIPKEAQPRIFEKFYRSDDATKLITEGSGLGLYVCKMIMEASGGRIWFESEGKNKGTTFYISTPITGMFEKKGERGLAA